MWEHELKWNLLTTQLITTCETFGHTTCVVVVVVNLLCIIIKLHSIYFALKRPMHSIFLSKNIFLRFSNSAIRFIHRWCSISLITRHIGAFHWNMTVCIWCVYNMHFGKKWSYCQLEFICLFIQTKVFIHSFESFFKNESGDYDY